MVQTLVLNNQFRRIKWFVATVTQTCSQKCDDLNIPGLFPELYYILPLALRFSKTVFFITVVWLK